MKCNKEKQRKKGKKTQATEKTQPAKEQTPPSEDHTWTWTRIQLLPTQGSPPPGVLTSMMLHPVEHRNILLIFGGKSEASASNLSVPTDFAWRFNMNNNKWDGTILLSNGPSQSIGGQMVSSLDTGKLWHWGGGSSTTNCFVSKLRKLEENSGASAKLEFSLELNDPFSDGKNILPPIMGAISEEKQALLLSLKSERDSHAKDLQMFCKKPSRRDWKKTKHLINAVRKSRRAMLNASKSMSEIIYATHPKDDDDGDEADACERGGDDNLCKAGEGGDEDHAQNLNNVPVPHANIRNVFQDEHDADPALSRTVHTTQGGNRRTKQMTRSQTAPNLTTVLEHTAPFISMSCSRQFFNFGVMGMKTPRWSRNTLLSPVPSKLHQLGDDDGREEKEEGEVILAGLLR